MFSCALAFCFPLKHSFSVFLDIDNNLPSGALRVQLTQGAKVRVVAVVVLMAKELITVLLLIKSRNPNILRIKQKKLLVYYLLQFKYDYFCVEMVGFIISPHFTFLK